MSELKPCPFCGGTAKLSVYYDFYRVHCNNDDCIAGLSASDAYGGHGRWYKSISEAREAWNTRAERTCHIVKEAHKIVLSDGTELFENGCSECNSYLDDFDNYCSNCGARVTPKCSETTPKVVCE